MDLPETTSSDDDLSLACFDNTTRRLATYASSIDFADIDKSNGTVAKVKQIILDSIGCAAAGCNAKLPTLFRKIMVFPPGSSSQPTSRVWFSDIGDSYRTTTVEAAAFVNAVAVRELEMNDAFFNPGGGHPSDMIAALFAIGESVNATGEQLITAITISYEIFQTLSSQISLGKHGFDQGVFIVISTAIGLGKLLGLSTVQLANAISLALVPNVALGATRKGEVLSNWKGGATAYSAKAAIFAVMLAEKNVSGPPQPFSGEDGVLQMLSRTNDFNLKVMGNEYLKSKHRKPFSILDTAFKVYACQYYLQGPVEAALDIYKKMQNENLDYKDIARIQAWVFDVSCRQTAEKSEPETAETADHSLQFCVAVCLKEGVLSTLSYNNEHLQDPEILSLAKCVEVLEDPIFSQAYPTHSKCRLCVTTTNARMFEYVVDDPLGSCGKPLTQTDVEAKFMKLASYGNVQKPSEIIRIVNNLECVNVRDLVDVLK